MPRRLRRLAKLRSHQLQSSQEVTACYWQDEDGYVGRLKEVPGIFSQGETLDELEDNVRDAYDLVISDAMPAPAPAGAESRLIEVEV